jgi:hypothetical protein
MRLHARILEQLLPDEARMLATLARLGRAATVDVQTRTARPGAGRAILELASSLGRMSGVTLPDRTPTYMAHLLAAGLIELLPEDASLEEQYDLLAAEPAVRAALAAGKADGALAPRLVKGAVRLSALGTELWAAVRPADAS